VGKASEVLFPPKPVAFHYKKELPVFLNNHHTRASGYHKRKPSFRPKGQSLISLWGQGAFLALRNLQRCALNSYVPAVRPHRKLNNK
jgi:hypothetical protein